MHPCGVSSCNSSRTRTQIARGVALTSRRDESTAAKLLLLGTPAVAVTADVAAAVRLPRGLCERYGGRWTREPLTCEYDNLIRATVTLTLRAVPDRTWTLVAKGATVFATVRKEFVAKAMSESACSRRVLAWFWPAGHVCRLPNAVSRRSACGRGV